MPPVTFLADEAAADVTLAKVWTHGDQLNCFGQLPSLPPPRTLSSFLSTAISAHLPSLLRANGKPVREISIGVNIVDPILSQLILMQSIEFSQRALCNASANYFNARNGLETWTRVTNYYSGYFSVHSMLGLQGRAITQIVDSNQKKLKVYVYPLDLINHSYVVTTRHLGTSPHHVAPWRKFYDIYETYSLRRTEYEAIARIANGADPVDESAQRNLINYTPYEGFEEVASKVMRNNFKNMFFSNDKRIFITSADIDDIISNLSALSTDADYSYFARSLLKILFVYEFLDELSTSNVHVKNYWAPLRKKWSLFLADALNQRVAGRTALREAISSLP